MTELYRDDAVHWVTGVASPCIAIFKPLFVATPLPPQGPRLGERYDAASLWWKHEQLHRAALRGDFGRFVSEISAERDALEAEFYSEVRAVRCGTPEDRSRVVADCWRRALETEDRWFSRLRDVTPAANSPYDVAWAEMSELAAMPV